MGQGYRLLLVETRDSTLVLRDAPLLEPLSSHLVEALCEWPSCYSRYARSCMGWLRYYDGISLLARFLPQLLHLFLLGCHSFISDKGDLPFTYPFLSLHPNAFPSKAYLQPMQFCSYELRWCYLCGLQMGKDRTVLFKHKLLYAVVPSPCFCFSLSARTRQESKKIGGEREG